MEVSPGAREAPVHRRGQAAAGAPPGAAPGIQVQAQEEGGVFVGVGDCDEGEEADVGVGVKIPPLTPDPNSKS